ncbi:hypothetical protein V5799_029203 [Amblyomma americanum]|uniref:ABC transporter domain-containing protein n=1 Tax=Amblyomma americanum TaxID=6943 RepID=A0AAQ4ERU8_AMBAM
MNSGAIAAELLKTAPGITFVLRNLLPLLSLAPSYSFMSALFGTVSKSQIAWICSRSTLDSYRRICVEPTGGFSGAAEEERRNNEDFVEYCCSEFLRTGAKELPDVSPKIQDVIQVFLMLAQGVLFLMLLLYLDSGGLDKLRGTFLADGGARRAVPVHTVMDQDVEEEETRVRKKIIDSDIGDDVVAVLEFTKKFRKRLVVNGVSFGVGEGEVFGLLGVAGSGKSTLLRMLVTELVPDRGRALMRTPRGPVALRAGPKAWQPGLGYCAQQDALIEQLSGADTLALFARLRGVPESRVARVVVDFARLVGIETVLGEKVEFYSGGMRRRLSVAMALVGLPPLVLLDDPTAGVDVVARRKLWDTLRGLQEVARTSVIISTGSMDEVENVCDRVAIMIRGEFQCLGSLERLKDRFAQGFTVVVNTHDEYKEDYEYRAKVIRAIADNFPNSKLEQSYEGYLEYHVENTGLSWSEMFAQAETLKRKLNLLDFLISNTTLDHVYAALATLQRGRPKREQEGADEKEDE